jgi:monovalent cation:H+ antiporter-2, CPA2 family
MSFDFDLLLKSFPYVALVAMLLIFVKSSVIMILCKIFRFPSAPAFHTALLLSQGGELAFVIFLMAVQINFMEVDLSQFLMTVVTFTMALTPLLASIGRKIKGRLYTREVLKDGKLKREIGDLSKHVIVIGFSRIGRIVANILRKQNINYIILDANHRVVKLEKESGYNIYYGDAKNIDILKNIGIERSESVIVCHDDNIACLHITKFIHENFKDVNIFTKADSIDNANRLRKSGATLVVSKNLETALQLSSFGLSSAGLSNDQIEKALEVFRDIDSDVVKEILKYNETEKNF